MFNPVILTMIELALGPHRLGLADSYNEVLHILDILKTDTWQEHITIV